MKVFLATALSATLIVSFIPSAVGYRLAGDHLTNPVC